MAVAAVIVVAGLFATISSGAADEIHGYFVDIQQGTAMYYRATAASVINGRLALRIVRYWKRGRGRGGGLVSRRAELPLGECDYDAIQVQG